MDCGLTMITLIGGRLMVRIPLALGFNNKHMATIDVSKLTEDLQEAGGLLKIVYVGVGAYGCIPEIEI